MHRFRLIPVLLLVLARAHAAEPAGATILDRTQSFEDGMPAFVAAAKGRISISDARAQDGRHALRWDWVPGDTLTFTTGPIGDINTASGFGGYYFPAFAISVYTETVGDGAFTCTWMAGDQAGAHVDIPLVFSGWQRLCYHYRWETRLAGCRPDILAMTDRITVAAPKEGAGGTAYFDTIDFNKPVDYRNGHEVITRLWKPLDIRKEVQDPMITAPPTAPELAAVTRLLTVTPGTRTWTEKDLTEGPALERRCRDKYALERLASGRVGGKVIADFPVAVGADLKWLADRWGESSPTTDPRIRKRIEEAYFLLDDFFREAGAVAQGAIGDLRWYRGRDHAAACFTMQEPLRRTGRLERIRNCLKFHNDYDAIFHLPEVRTPIDVDFFHTNADYLLKIALMHDRPAETVAHLRAVSRQINIAVIDTIESDGSIYQHNFYNFPYVSYGFPSMAHYFRYLAPTPFALSQKAFAKAKQTAMGMRWFCNLTQAPIFMHGRHPGICGLVPKQYLLLAEAGRAYNHGRLDRDLAAAYARLEPKDAANPILTAERIAPEPAPQGNQALNFAQVMGHRRGEWLAVVRGYSRYLPAMESYNNANRHGLFLGNGYLDILATGSPINLVDSGCDTMKGWDWRHLDGTTSYDAPYVRIANGNNSMAECSDTGFVGGLSHRGRNGVYVMTLHSRPQHVRALPAGRADDGKTCFAANKSWFFFDERIVCLGSGIALPGSAYPVRTTLFQKILKAPSTPISVDGRPSAGLPWRAELPPATAHTLMDIQDTGYYLPAGQSVTVVREHQKSRDGHDEKDTEGDAATACIEHGTAPTTASYAYVAFPRTTTAQLARFAAAMGSAEDRRPLLIRQQDVRTHLVLDRSTRTWGGVFFAAQTIAPAAPTPRAPEGGKEDPPFPIATVSQPCLVMAEAGAEGAMTITVCDPDLHLDKKVSQPSTILVGLDGGWTLKGTPSGITATPGAAGASTIAITCREAASFTFTVTR